MILIGMFDSPFVRRVAISLKLRDLPFEHRNWSVGKDFERIRAYNPLGRVPTLVLDDGEVLIESGAILDYLDERAESTRRLIPAAGVARRTVLRLVAIATGAAEKGVMQVYERAFRPYEKRHEPWVDRCHVQVIGALAELERVASRSVNGWLVGGKVPMLDWKSSAHKWMLNASNFKTEYNANSGKQQNKNNNSESGKNYSEPL